MTTIFTGFYKEIFFHFQHICKMFHHQYVIYNWHPLFVTGGDSLEPVFSNGLLPSHQENHDQILVSYMHRSVQMSEVQNKTGFRNHISQYIAENWVNIPPEAPYICAFPKNVYVIWIYEQWITIFKLNWWGEWTIGQQQHDNNYLKGGNHPWKNSEVYSEFLVRLRSPWDNWEGFKTYTATHHQGAIETLWLYFWRVYTACG